MTLVAPAPGATEPRPEPDDQPTIVDDEPIVEPPPNEPFLTASTIRIIVVWFVLTLVGVLVVLLGLSPSVEQRDQRALFDSYTAAMDSASNQAFGLPGVQVPTEAPSPGAAVGVLDAQGTSLHVVVVEGTEPSQTRSGPGHIVGTAGPGQPGNSAVVARRHLYGGTFGSLENLAIGDRILVSTVQGQTAYTVRYVGHRQITDEPPASDATTTTTAAPAADAKADGPLLPDGSLTPAQLFGPTPDDRLTLVTSDSDLPWSTGDAVVVVARLDGQPFAPTPQGGRTSEGDGRHGDPDVAAGLILASLLIVVAITGAVWLHRNLPWRSAYLLSAPVLVATTVLLAEQLAATLPAWT
jgi:sortase A